MALTFMQPADLAAGPSGYLCFRCLQPIVSGNLCRLCCRYLQQRPWQVLSGLVERQKCPDCIEQMTNSNGNGNCYETGAPIDKERRTCEPHQSDWNLGVRRWARYLTPEDINAA